MLKIGEKQVKLVKKEGKKVRKYGVDLGERGVYDIRNPLNELTGREWTYFINSIHETDFTSNEDELRLWKFLQDSLIPTKFLTKGEDSIGHNLRKVHPSPKPPTLMKDIIYFFTKNDGKILDPFMGVGGTLLGASLCDPERYAVGIDLSKEYIEVYNKVCEQEGLKKQVALVGDARGLDKFNEVKSEKFDLILTDPPYANMMAKKRTGGDKTKIIGETKPFTIDVRDLGNINYEKFLKEFEKIIGKSIKFLKNKGYVVVFCKDIQPTKDHHNLLHADIVSSLYKIDSLHFKGYKIWYDKTLNLYPYGYPFSFVANQLHQYILIFRKEDKK